MNTDIQNLFKDKVLGHPAGLFVVFFTENVGALLPKAVTILMLARVTKNH